MSRHMRTAMFYVMAAMAVVLALFWMGRASARGGPHEGNSPEVSQWFSAQHNSRGGWCCNDADGHRYYGEYTLNADGSVTIHREQGGDIKIEAWKVLSGPNPTGSAVWWYLNGPTGEPSTFCFAPGPLT